MSSKWLYPVFVVASDAIRRTFVLLAIINITSGVANTQNPFFDKLPPATLQWVESMPTHMEDLNATVKLHTHTALVELLDRATSSVDLAVMYWSLLPEDCGWMPKIGSQAHPDDERGVADCAGFSTRDFDDKFLAGRGKAVYDALVRALRRGVKIRVLQSAGFPSEDSHARDPNPESAALSEKFPANFLVRTLNMSSWYGEGIQHAKFLVVDRTHILIGSSNFMDFRSLSLVKELGVRIWNTPNIALDLTMFFEDAYTIAAIDDPAYFSKPYWDDGALRTRNIPSWSFLRPSTSRTPSPLPISSPSTKDNPLHIDLDGALAPVPTFISCSPPAFCGGNHSTKRTGDEVTLVSTILAAETDVAVAVMDFIPSSMSLWSNGPPIFWPSLIDALIRVVHSKGVRARLLLSQWAWTDPTMMKYLQALNQTAAACADTLFSYANECRGSLEVRIFEVPGWNSTQGPDRLYPGHSRVNHNKYIVTDSVVNIATSNMAWSYFYTTLGASINFQDTTLARGLMNTVFDRDWNSIYAHRPFEV